MQKTGIKNHEDENHYYAAYVPPYGFLLYIGLERGLLLDCGVKIL